LHVPGGAFARISRPFDVGRIPKDLIAPAAVH